MSLLEIKDVFSLRLDKTIRVVSAKCTLLNARHEFAEGSGSSLNYG
jgi:hypothetical protein